MNESEKFYLESLYPLQDGVLSSIRKSTTPFFLTGGTALSRAYLNHRYSDDLDFFVNSDNDFIIHVEQCLSQLLDDEYIWNEKKFIKTKDFCQYFIYTNHKPDVVLKVDFVNDIASHFGGILETELFIKTDSVRNILSNKISALFRLAAKDVVDLVYLAANYSFHWSDIINEAREKDSGIEATVVSEILKTFPVKKLDEINWVVKPNNERFMLNLMQMAKDCIEVKANSLYIQ
ncbi:nucleotidyl transferase AbiEii/AbiGii toxin family protein [Leptospira sp. GIMC2001]|uniref:nucleotidyl transferase AbiEii/AbiGii toxin family protein n=1 Tax=Leptospira sp. GIMC2001 TaxID=1513297 RepID=UPI002349B109|nr:nucleotidyl transferase AbiEii/AbiGii toxin family protein [Leptospira sp. GIMC2001]WCL51192.1 nucleotidyl transferase AbiEii/AbiGii toxin family protein [Leptospira sp. GIMC2001]